MNPRRDARNIAASFCLRSKAFALLVPRHNSIGHEKARFVNFQWLGRRILEKREVLGEQGPFRGLREARGERASDALLPQFLFNFDVLFAAAVQAAQL
jgi:hypothetical protein